MNTKVPLILLAGFVAAGIAKAAPYWVAYEGSDFPENEGWTRFSRGGGALRSLDDGSLILDARDGVDVTDWYAWTAPIDPEAGEEFVMRWRFLIEVADPRTGVGVDIFSDESWAVGLLFDEDGLESVFESGVVASFAPGLFHDFELHSTDMRAYSLTIDGLLAYEGDFVHVLTESEVNWGDGIVGGQSLAAWDYVRFGVVPEPSTLACLVVACAALARRPS